MLKLIIYLSIIGTSLGALIPVDQAYYSNFLSARHPQLFSDGQVGGPDVKQIGVNPPRQYLVYNVPQPHTGIRTIPMAIFTNGRPTIAHIPTTYKLFGTPIYDFRFPLEPISPPGQAPLIPGYIPLPAIPQIPNNPPPEDDDGIEKLDEKVDPSYDPLGEKAGATDSQKVSSDTNDDTVSVEAA